MYKKILLPTDGSPLASEAAQVGVAFAKDQTAEVIGLFVSPEYQYPVFTDMIPPNFPTEEEYAALIRKEGDSYLEPIKRMAEQAGLRFTSLVAFSNTTAKAIGETASQQNCDLIFIGSHGRSGLGQLLVGSVTAKLLSLCQVPVLVYRTKQT